MLKTKNYKKIVGNNPNIIVEDGEIILQGTEQSFKYKSLLNTGLKAIDFFD